MELQDAYTYELNPRAHANAECADTNDALQRRLGEDMDSCSFTHGTLMRACDIEERDEAGAGADPAELAEQRAGRAEQAEAYRQYAAQAAQAAQADTDAADAADAVEAMHAAAKPSGASWLGIFPAGMSSAYVMLIAVIVVLLVFAMMRKRR